MDIAQVILILCLIPLAALIFRFPELGLVLCLIIGSLFKGMVQPLLGPLDITVCLFAVTYGSIFIRCCMEKKLGLPDFRINIGVLLLIALLLASLLYTPLLGQGAEVFLRFVFLTISMLYATYMWCTNIKRIKRLLFIFVGIMLAYGTAALVWVFLVLSEVRPVSEAVFPGADRLSIAQLLAAAIPAAFILRKLVQSKSQRLFLDMLMIIGIVELIALNSRGPIIAFVAGAICLFLLYSPGEKKRFAQVSIPTIIVIVCAFFLLPSEYTGRYALVADIQSSSVAARLDMWQFVTAHFSDWFFTGAGIFGFGYYYYPMGTELSIWGSYTHNVFLDVFAAAGFFGLLAFVWLIGSLIYEGVKVSRSSHPSFHLLSLATVVALITFLVAGLFSMSIIGTRPLWLLGGVVLSLERLWRKENEQNTTNMLKDRE